MALRRRRKTMVLHRTDHRLDLSPAGRNLFVSREKELQQRQAQRIRRWMRLVMILVLAAAGVTAGIIAFHYLAPWFRSEITVEDAGSSTASALATPAPDEPTGTDAQGLPEYGEEVTLFIINSWDPAPEGFLPELELAGTVSVDKRMVPALNALLAAAQADGVPLTFTEGYVAPEEQQRRFDAKVQELMKTQGLTAVMARTEAAALTPKPGESDFQTGFCLRVTGDPAAVDSTRVYSWLRANMGKYGFIFRYPQYKEASTGMAYDPTVIRWVGGAAAAAMQQRGLCLEEYIDYLATQ